MQLSDAKVWCKFEQSPTKAVKVIYKAKAWIAEGMTDMLKTA